jgi:hypothetical protein
MFTSKHNPNGGAKLNFDNAAVESLIARYQASRDLETLSAIVDLARPRALTLIRFRRTMRYCSEAELLSDVNCKLMRAVDKFDPAKATAFTFLSQVMLNTLCTSVANARKNAEQHTKLKRSLVEVLPDKSEDQTTVEDIAHRIRAGAKTTLTDPGELSAQRWFIDSFTADGFESPRHECANAAMAVHSLSHGRSRELYDLTMLEVRRVLYDDLKGRQSISAGRLLGTRFAWMARYRPLLSESEFSKFVILARNLSPFILMLIDPESRSRRQDRNPAIGRRNLEWVLNGHPASVPLFKFG